MNHIYRTIWNEKTGTFVAVSELTKSGGKKASGVCGDVAGVGLALRTTVASLLMGFAMPLWALPTDGVVAAGSATITSSPGNMTINQSSQKVALNWQSFNIGQGEAVQFVQPNTSAVALNRVLGADPSSILGSLSANGQVFLINPNGIVFGQGASVNVNGLVASTLDISDADFMAGEYAFAGDSAAAVLNQGEINADGGYVVLLGKDVSNQGVITARLGTVALAAGEAITLDMIGDGLLTVGIDQGAVDALVANGGLIQADGGQVLMSAQSAGNLLNTVVNNTGVIQAQTIENRDGVIRLLGDMPSGTVNAAGTLDASAPDGGDGGFIETSAAHVKVADNAKITTAAAHGKTGTWLIDPTDYTVAATDPGNGSSYMSNAALSTSLNSSNVIIQSLADGAGNGDIHVNGAVSWSANNTLTLDAHRNININQSITATGDSGKLTLKYGQGAGDGVIAGVAATYNVNAPVNLKAGNNFSTQLGSTGVVKDYTVITSLGAQGSTTKTDLQGINGGLMGNYALGSNIDASATSGWNGSAGFVPVGNSSTSFTGSFDGLGHSIANLTINRSASDIGLFGGISAGAVIRNVGLLGGSIKGEGSVGGLVGWNAGAINNSYVTGGVIGSGDYIGGLVGLNKGKVTNSYATGSVNGAGTHVGGLVGGNEPPSSISNSYATGSVTGGANVGGLVGYIGGYGAGSSISNSYATGSVSGHFAGGLVGYNFLGSVSNSYATGSVSGTGDVGQLMGVNYYGAISNTYWDNTINATGIGGGVASGALGLSTEAMKTMSSFSGWDIANTGASGGVWRIYEGHTAPLLTSFMTGLTLSGAPDATVTYNGAAQSGGVFALIDGVLGAAATGTNAGFYNGYYSTQQGYDISGGNITIDKANLAISTSDVNKVYDGGLSAAGSASGTLFGDDTLTGGTFVFTDKNAGTNKTVKVSEVTVNDGNNGGNYNVSYADNATSTIDPFAVSLTGSRVYDGTADVGASDLTIGSLVGSETLTLAGSGTVADKHVANGKTVTLGSLALSDGTGLASNYSFIGGIHSVDITPAALRLSTEDVVKLFDSNTVAAGMATVTAGKLFDTDTIAGGSFAFTDPNVGRGNKTVTTNGVTITDGNNGDNYSVTYAKNTSSTITSATIIETESAPSTTGTALLQNARATAASSGTSSDVSVREVLSGPNQALPTPPAANSSAVSSLAGLNMVVVNEGIRLAPDMEVGVPFDDDNAD